MVVEAIDAALERGQGRCLEGILGIMVVRRMRRTHAQTIGPCAATKDFQSAPHGGRGIVPSKLHRSAKPHRRSAALRRWLENLANRNDGMVFPSSGATPTLMTTRHEAI